MRTTFKCGDEIWFKNPRATMNRIIHAQVLAQELHVTKSGCEVRYKTKNHGWISEHYAGETEEQAVVLYLYRKYFSRKY